jgi:hypothetical protein
LEEGEKRAKGRKERGETSGRRKAKKGRKKKEKKKRNQTMVGKPPSEVTLNLHGPLSFYKRNISLYAKKGAYLTCLTSLSLFVLFFAKRP